MPETFTVYLTKDALRRGRIQKVEAVLISANRGGTIQTVTTPPQIVAGPKTNWFRDLDLARERVRQMRVQAVRALTLKIKRLRDLRIAVR